MDLHYGSFGVYARDISHGGYGGSFQMQGAGGDLFLLELLALFFAQAGGLVDEFHVGSGGLEVFDCLHFEE